MNTPLLVDDYGLKPKKEYIIVTKPDVDHVEFVEILKRHNIDINVDFDGLARHYHVSFLEEKYDEMLAESDILIIEDANRPVILMESQLISVDSTGYGGNWGLTRLCRRGNWNDSTWYPNTGNYTYFRDGEGVDVYIVDTGCRTTHADFGGRASVIFDYYLNPSNPMYGTDVQGHGTHVASTVGGATYGVAKKANLLISRVFESGGATLAAVVAGINACAKHHKNKKQNGINRPSIMNLSLGGPANVTEEHAINDCINDGIIICAAAGNDGKNLEEVGYDVMPAEIERAITVGSCDIRDRISSFSNYGKMVDVFAPGHYICAAGIAHDAAENMISGTSMASPHVAGVCALYVQGKTMTNNASDVREVHDWVKNNATKNTLHLSSVVSATGAPNNLLYSEYIEAPIVATAPVTEVGRLIDIETVVDVVKSVPVLTTMHEDVIAIVENVDGTTTTTTTRVYTDTSVVTVTTNTTDIEVVTVTYSDGTETITRGDPTVMTVVTTEETVTTRDEIINQEITSVPKVEVNRINETATTYNTVEGAPITTTDYVDNISDIVNAGGSTTKTTTRVYTDTTTVLLTTTVTDIITTTVYYNDNTTDVLTSAPVDTIATEDRITVVTREEILDVVIIPAPTKETPPTPPTRKTDWRTRGKWSRVKHLSHRIDTLENMLTSSHNGSILDPIEVAAEAFVDAGRRDKVKAFNDFMDIYNKLKDLLE